MLKTTSPICSVVVSLLFLGCILFFVPLNVWSQTVPNTNESQTADPSTQSSEKKIINEETNPSLVTSSPVIVKDNYQRENLPDKEVYSDFVVGPGKFEIQLLPGETKTVEIIISNRMGVDKIFSITTEDTSGTKDASQSLVLLGDDHGPYTLKDYISVPIDEFLIHHGERVHVPVTVNLPIDAEPGAHYGSLLVSIVSDPNKSEIRDTAVPTSAIISRIGTLFFITNPGATSSEGKLQKFSTISNHKLYTTGPIAFGAVFANTGDIHLNPYGEIKITNTFGNEVGFIQLEPWFVMPKSLRVREVAWDRQFLVGRYVATASINRGYDNIVDVQSTVFWVLPWKLLLSIFVVLLIVFATFRFLFTRFEFRRKK